MVTLLGNKNNIYTWAVDTTAKTLKVSNVTAFDLYTESLVSMYSVTASLSVDVTKVISCVRTVVAGLPVFTYTFSAMPAVANGDTFLIFVSVPDTAAVYSILQVVAGATI